MPRCATCRVGPARPGNLIKDDTESIQSDRQILSRWTTIWLCRQPSSIGASTVPEGESINIVPALEATALEADRYRSEIHPWISLHALLLGSPGLLHGYPCRGRSSRSVPPGATHEPPISTAATAQAASQFAEAMQQFTADVRGLAETIEPDRQQLPIVERDRGLLAKTAYPAVFATDAEVLYNRVDPFFWSGCASLAAACILGLSFLPCASRFSGPASP